MFGAIGVYVAVAVCDCANVKAGGAVAVVVVGAVVDVVADPSIVDVVVLLVVNVESEREVAVAAGGSEVANPSVFGDDDLVSFVVTLAFVSLPTNTIVKMINPIKTAQTATNAMRRAATCRRSSGHDDNSSSH